MTSNAILRHALDTGKLMQGRGFVQLVLSVVREYSFPLTCPQSQLHNG
jgi:hypothetical protein